MLNGLSRISCFKENEEHLREKQREREREKKTKQNKKHHSHYCLADEWRNKEHADIGIIDLKQTKQNKNKKTKQSKTKQNNTIRPTSLTVATVWRPMVKEIVIIYETYKFWCLGTE